MNEILNQLFEHKTLTKEQAREVLINLTGTNCNHSQMAAFISVFLMRSITVDELKGFQSAMLDLCLKTDFSHYNAIDIVGTGGDGKNTFNISTLACFVVSGAGFKVTKHGNYGVSSISGSSNVMEHLGYKFTNDKDILERQLDKSGVCFLHAPLFHPAMKNVAPVRKDLSIRTFFNLLGPLVNPSFPKYKLLGVFNLELLRLYNYILQQKNEKFMLVHSLDGYDEISLTSSFKVISDKKEMSLEPEEIKMKKLNQADLYGGASIIESAAIFTKILNGEGTEAQNNAVVVNAAAAINCVHPEKTFIDCISIADESLKSKKALRSFKTLIELN